MGCMALMSDHLKEDASNFRVWNKLFNVNCFPLNVIVWM